MPKLWLPIKEETSGREMLILIPGASHMDRSQLEEIIAWQKETTLRELKALGPRPKARYSRKEVGQALNEFRMFLERKRKGTGKKYY